MEILGWFFSAMFWVVYIVCLFTVCKLTFQKGHTLLGIVGIFLPFLWLIGAILPESLARGTRHSKRQRNRHKWIAH